MNKAMSERLGLHNRSHHYKSHLSLPDPDKQFYLFTDSSKHSWSGILIQYMGQVKEDGTKLNVTHPITYQSGTFQGSQKNWSTLTKEAYAIYISLCKMVFYLKEVHIMVRCDLAPYDNLCTQSLRMMR